MSEASIQNVSLDNFDEVVLKSDALVLVDFWAEWCGPCKIIAPVVEEIAEEYGNNLQVCKLDVDANPGVAEKYGVRGIPTLMLFHQGAVVDSKVGAVSKSQLSQFIDSHMPAGAPSH